MGFYGCAVMSLVAAAIAVGLRAASPVGPGPRGAGDRRGARQVAAALRQSTTPESAMASRTVGDPRQPRDATTPTSTRRGAGGARGAGAARRRSQGGRWRRASSGGRRGRGSGSASPSSIRRDHRRGRRSRCRTPATARSPAARFPADLQRQWIQGTGPAARPNAPVGDEHPQRRLRAAVGRRRLDVRRRGRARPDLDDVARQPAQPQAGHPSRSGVPGGRRAGRRRDEPVGAGLFRARPIVDDWRQQLDFTTKIFRARGLHLDDRHVRHAGRRRLLRVDRRRGALRRQQPRAAAQRRRVARALPARRSRPPKKRRSGTTS